MLFRSSLLFTALAAASTALAGPIQARGALATSCLPAGIEASCYSLISSCLTGTTAATKNNLWGKRACVAAATCYGVGNLENSVACQLNTAVTNQAQASLDYTIYAGIVGDCAYAAGGCPITQQNYIDFYYSTLTAIGSGSFPTSPNTVISWWFSIAGWTATGNTIPYVNFNDWLHYSTYPSPVVTSSSGTVTSTLLPITSTPTPVPTATSSTVTASVTTSVVPSYSESDGVTSSISVVPSYSATSAAPTYEPSTLPTTV